MKRSAVCLTIGLTVFTGILNACDGGRPAASAGTTTAQEAPLSGITSATVTVATPDGYSGVVTLTARPAVGYQQADKGGQEAVRGCGADQSTVGVVRIDVKIKSTTDGFALSSDYKLFVRPDSSYLTSPGIGDVARTWLLDEYPGRTEIWQGSACVPSGDFGSTSADKSGPKLAKGEEFTDSMYSVLQKWKSPAHPSGLTEALYWLQPSLYVGALGGSINSLTKGTDGAFHQVRFAVHP